MIYGILLAGGKGTRIKDEISLPKQFRLLGDKPILIITLETFLKTNKFNYIYITVSADFINYTEELLKKYNIDTKKIKIVNGGNERIDSIENAIKEIQFDNNISEEDIVIIHDSVRPFVSTDLINKCINGANTHKAVVCAARTTDTLFISNDGDRIDEIPNRSIYYKGQSPDAYNLELYTKLIFQIKKEDRKKITGDAEVCILNNYPVHIIEGDNLNYKLTTKSDFVIAEAIVKSDLID